MWLSDKSRTAAVDLGNHPFSVRHTRFREADISLYLASSSPLFLTLHMCTAIVDRKEIKNE
jgi:hypothetical protein